MEAVRHISGVCGSINSPLDEAKQSLMSACGRRWRVEQDWHVVQDRHAQDNIGKGTVR